MGSKHKQIGEKTANMGLKVFLISCMMMTCCLGMPQSKYPVENEIPQPYQYQYGVKDDYSKSNFAKTESQDDKGNVQGTFVISLPDGRIQTTTYTADPVRGFIAEVTYQGEPVYPEPKQYSASNK